MKKSALLRRFGLAAVSLFSAILFFAAFSGKACFAAEKEKSGAAPKYLSGNLIRNGGFEAVDEKNKPIDWVIRRDPAALTNDVVEVDSTVKHRGKNSLKLAFRKAAKNDLVSLRSVSIVPQSGKYYRVTGWLRQQNFAADRTVGWSDIHLKDSSGYWHWRIGTPSSSNFDWQFVEKMLGPAANEKELVLTLGLQIYEGNPVVWYDDFSVQEYIPPPVPANAKTWVYPAQKSGTGGAVVGDPDATGGKAYQVAKADGAGIKLSLACISEQPAGLYRTTFRLKTSDTSKDYVICEMTMLLTSSGKDAVHRPLFTREFKEPNKYQDFTIDFILPARGLIPVFSFPAGGDAILWIDKVTITQLAEYTDDDLEALYGD